VSCGERGEFFIPMRRISFWLPIPGGRRISRGYPACLQPRRRPAIESLRQKLSCTHTPNLSKKEPGSSGTGFLLRPRIAPAFCMRFSLRLRSRTCSAHRIAVGRLKGPVPLRATRQDFAASFPASWACFASALQLLCPLRARPAAVCHSTGVNCVLLPPW